MSAPVLQAIPLGRIRESPLNPRRHFDAAGLEELGESLRAHGQLTPCLVRPAGEEYELAAGHRRRRAAERAGLDTLQCLVRQMSDAEFLEVLTIENLQREDVHPLDEGLGYQRLLELPGYDVAGVAAKVGKSESYVYQRLRLADLVPKAQEAFLEGRFTPGHALLIARLTPADQAAALKELGLRGGDYSIASFRGWIQRAVLRDLHGVPFALDDAELVAEAGSCAACPKRTGHQRELLPSLDDGGKKGSDRCLDPACFARKLAAGLTQRLEQLRAKHGEVLELSTNYHGDGKKSGPLTADRWWRAKKSDPGAKPGLVMEGWREVGSLLWVTVSRPRATGSGVSPQERRAAEKRKRERARHRAILTAMQPRLSGVLDDPTIRGLVRGYLHEMTHDVLKVTCQFFDLDTKGSPREILDAHLEALDTLGATRLLQLLPHMPALTGYGEPKALLETAERLGVDLATIEAELAAAAPKKRKAAKTTKRTKKAAPAKARPAAKTRTKRLAGDVRRAKAGKKKAAT